MTDDELRASWPELGRLVAALRAQGQGDLASRLVDRVQYASTSGEIYNGVGNELMQHKALRRALDQAGSAAWGQVMKDIERLWRKL